MYNEKKDVLKRTLDGIHSNLGNGKLDKNEVLVVIFQDGIDRMYKFPNKRIIS